MKAPVSNRLVRYTTIVLLLSACTNLTQTPDHQSTPNSRAAVVDQSALDAAMRSAKNRTPDMPFIAHTSPTPFGRYVAMNVPLDPIYELNRQLSAKYGRQLTDRGEAHITVITPPEFDRLAPYLDIDELNEFFAPVLQAVDFEAVCIGRGQKEIDHVVESTYFIVIESSQLRQLRWRITQRYLQRGGPAPAFEQPYYPHITIGFTRRDLHASDDVQKSPATCLTDKL